ncbi:hypothetical protein MNBD_GAMMA18-488 [hydrothermal vent metagenome]|uniref:BrnT family toxin n=1 Tax=hydrothermal vent metagenome TaxID=652676 RepID=A0A3B0Z7Y9_9ZZZZ
MSELKFTWDDRKDSANQKKHGISFDEAILVFDDDNARLIPDPNHSEDEDRYILLGLCSQLRVLVVCHCYRNEDLSVRVISARKANKSEAKQYEGFRHAR